VVESDDGLDDNKDEEDGDEGGLAVVENDLVDGGGLDKSDRGGLDGCVMN
jgi:hypothetical protein